MMLGMRARWWIRLQGWVVRHLDGLAVGRGRGGARHLRTGLDGEREALFHLREKGYVVVARRWTTPKVRGDVDLIAWDGGVLCFVEVKTRTARGEIAAEAAVDAQKQQQLRRLASVYMKGFEEEARERVATRFDVVSVYLRSGRREFEVMQGAFSVREPAWNHRMRIGV